jgi:hypothetical protein
VMTFVLIHSLTNMGMLRERREKRKGISSEFLLHNPSATKMPVMIES